MLQSANLGTKYLQEEESCLSQEATIQNVRPSCPVRLFGWCYRLRGSRGSGRRDAARTARAYREVRKDMDHLDINRHVVTDNSRLQLTYR